MENIYLDITEKENVKQKNDSEDEYVYLSESESSDEDIQLTETQKKKFDNWVKSEKNNEFELEKLKKTQEKRKIVVADLIHKKMEKQKKEEEYIKNETKIVSYQMYNLMGNLQKANQKQRNRGYNKYATINMKKKYNKNKVALFKLNIF